jgi:hypothetical protein
MDRRNRGRRNYAFDNYRSETMNARNRNLEKYFSANFGPRQRNIRRNNNAYDYLPQRRGPAPQQRRNEQLQNRRNGPFQQSRRQRRLQAPRNLPLQDNRVQVRRQNNNSGRREPIRTRQRKLQNQQQPKNIGNRQTKRILRRRSVPIGKLDIENIGEDVINEDLITIFGAYGRLQRCAVLFKDGISLKKGVVQYASRACAQRACHDLNGTFVKGSNISVTYHTGKVKPNKPEGQDVNMN